MTTRHFAVVALAALFAPPVAAQWTSSRPDGHAPIGVMGDHRHEAGEIMLAYRFMRMHMEGSRVGTDAVDAAAIVAADGEYGFMVTPTKMPMDMHMFGVMFAPSDRITLMAMVPFITTEMEHLTRAGGTFTTEASGVGDVGLSALVGLHDFGNQALHANIGVRFPTGSIEELGVTPMCAGEEVQLPYPMQLGSGTFDIEPGVTYLGQAGDWSWGGQARGTFRTGENDREYTLGNRYAGTLWGARRVNRNLSFSVRGEVTAVENIEGADPAPSVNPNVVPTARTDLRGGTRIDLAPGVNFYLPEANGLRFAAELLMPVMEDLDGPQLETDWTLIVGVQVVPRSH